MAVRSRRVFGPIQVVPAGTVLYTVPAGRTLVLHTLAFDNYNVTNQTFSLYINGVRFGRFPVVANQGGGQGDWRAFNPGDVLAAAADIATGVYLTGFGTLLLGAPV